MLTHKINYHKFITDIRSRVNKSIVLKFFRVQNVKHRAHRQYGLRSSSLTPTQLSETQFKWIGSKFRMDKNSYCGHDLLAT